jgi:hypothetical protein
MMAVTAGCDAPGFASLSRAFVLFTASTRMVLGCLAGEARDACRDANAQAQEVISACGDVATSAGCSMCCVRVHTRQKRAIVMARSQPCGRGATYCSPLAFCHLFAWLAAVAVGVRFVCCVLTPSGFARRG